MYIVQDDSSTDGAYIMWIFLIISFSTAMVTLVVWPRIFVWAREKYFTGNSSRRPPRINISGGGETRVTGLETTNHHLTEIKESGSSNVPMRPGDRKVEDGGVRGGRTVEVG